jgi:hypothetical protein
LYEPGTFDCWADADLGRSHAYIAIDPVPADATYELSEFTSYTTGNGGAFTRVQPTHFLEIRYTTTHDWGRCGVSEKKLYPRVHLFLVERNDAFKLTHYCPSTRTIETGIVEQTTGPNAMQAAANLSRLKDDEWMRIPQEIGGDPYSTVAQDRLQSDYGFDYRDAQAVIHHVCDRANYRPKADVQ